MKNQQTLLLALLLLLTLNLDLAAQEKTPLTINVEVLKKAICIDSEDGTLKIKAKGGQQPYQYFEIKSKSKEARIKEGNTFTRLDPGIYTIKVVDANGEEATTKITLEAIHPQPTADFTIETIDKALKFVNTSSGSGRWSWMVNEKTVSHTPSFQVELEEDYPEVCLEVSNGCNATDYYCKTIDVKTTLNNRTLTKKPNSIPTKINHQNGIILEPKLYPNPTSDQLTIAYATTSGLVTIEVYNMVGKNVKTVLPQSATRTTFSLNNLPVGMYLVKLHSPTYSKTLKVNKIN